ncbi:uncharacterized protein DEA37_0007450 [Paragonimus westermani]|uniref:Fibronectin type-III domain-containing protein n=1 Tax=Paragonimus westermani TaxID=34504 RepID=A0A5J4NFH8_9TREM|nr:uncharacterized protein DEA37_0007450 [Paragonimus westermani]
MPQISVATKNEVVQSDFVDTKPISTKLDYGPPLSPVNVKAMMNPAKAPVEEQSIELTWEQPTDQATSAGPDLSADFTITEPHCMLPSTGLKEFLSYEFCVTAENKAGKSRLGRRIRLNWVFKYGSQCTQCFSSRLHRFLVNIAGWWHPVRIRLSQ